MNNDILDLTSLKKAINSLTKALKEYEKDNTNEFVRDSCIQRFEYCYDLSSKMIKRHLKNIAENPGEIDQLSFQSIIREAYTKGILKNSWDKWSDFREDRNATSHGYDEELAVSIVSELNEPYLEFVFLLAKLEEIYEA
jgi:nucleotidyltransferase substrate binding protein (TIGR01987 family)